MNSQEISLDGYGIEIVKRFIGTLGFEIIENTYQEMDDGNGDVCSNHKLSIKLVPPADLEEDELEIDEFSSEIVPVMFAFAALSFDTARPRGYSENDFVSSDRFNIGEFLKIVEFNNGELRVSFDYLWGRCLKTSITANSTEWLIKLDTRNRGRSADQWVRTLQGKGRLKEVEKPATD